MKGSAFKLSVRILVFCLLTLLLAQRNSDARRAIPDNNLSYPVLINLGNSMGSGFYYKTPDSNYFVTARHVHLPGIHLILDNQIFPYFLRHKVEVQFDEKGMDLSFYGVMTEKEKSALTNTLPAANIVKDAIDELYKKSQTLLLSSNHATLLSWNFQTEEPPGVYELQLNLELMNKYGFIRYSPDSDVAIVKISTRDRTGGEEFYRYLAGVKMVSQSGDYPVSLDRTAAKKLKDVLVGNNVYMFGYPTSITKFPLLDIKKPLLRKGIVAGKNYEFRSIILDCPAFFGNSGGLVLEVEIKDRPYFMGIGVVSLMVPFIHQWVENSGYSVATAMDVVDELVAKFEPH